MKIEENRISTLQESEQFTSHHIVRDVIRSHAYIPGHGYALASQMFNALKLRRLGPSKC